MAEPADGIYVTAMRALWDRHAKSMDAATIEQFVTVYAADEDYRAAVDAARAPLLAEVERLGVAETDWQYGFTNKTTGEFVHHGDENQARALASVVKRPILRRQVWYGPIEPAAAASQDFFEEDEPVADVQAAFERGEKGTT